MAILFPLRVWLSSVASPGRSTEENEFASAKEQERRWLSESPAFFVYRRSGDGGQAVGLVAALETDDGALIWETTDQAMEPVNIPTVVTETQWDIDACLGEVMAGEPLLELRDAAGDEHALWSITDSDQIKLLQLMSQTIDTLTVAVAPPPAGRWPCVIFFLDPAQSNEAPAAWPQLWPGLLIPAEES